MKKTSHISPERLEELQRKTGPQAEYWIEEGKFFRDQAASTERWTLAAQLTITSGGVITILNASGIDNNSRFYALIWFFVGLLSTVALAYLKANAFANMYGFVSKAARGLQEFATTGNAEKLPDAIDFKSGHEVKRYEKLTGLLYFVPFFSIIVAALITLEGLN